MGMRTLPSPRSVAMMAASSSCSLFGLQNRQEGGSRRLGRTKTTTCPTTGASREPGMPCRVDMHAEAPPPPCSAHRSGAVRNAFHASLISSAGRWKALSSTVPLRWRSLLRSSGVRGQAGRAADRQLPGQRPASAPPCAAILPGRQQAPVDEQAEARMHTGWHSCTARQCF